jgi:hypothetical protein
MLPLRYDADSRSGFIRLREGKVVRTERLSPQAVAEYGRHGQLLTMALTDLEPDAAEFLRTADEESLLAVIERQQGGRAPRRAARPQPARRRR